MFALAGLYVCANQWNNNIKTRPEKEKVNTKETVNIICDDTYE